MEATAETIDEAATARLLDRGLPAWAAPLPAPPGDPIDLAIDRIRHATGRRHRSCSARDIAIALNDLHSALTRS